MSIKMNKYYSTLKVFHSTIIVGTARDDGIFPLKPDYIPIMKMQLSGLSQVFKK